MRKKIAVVGHGRGATSFAAAWLRANGIDVKHERMGPDGIVESGFSVPASMRNRVSASMNML